MKQKPKSCYKCKQHKAKRYCLRINKHICWKCCNENRVDLKCPTECEYHVEETANLFDSKIKADSMSEYYDFIDKHTHLWLKIQDRYIPAELKTTEEGKKEITLALSPITDRRTAEIYEKHLNIDLKTNNLTYVKSFEDIGIEFLNHIASDQWEEVRNYFSHKDPITINTYIDKLKKRKELKNLDSIIVTSSGTSQDGKKAFSSTELNFVHDISLIFIKRKKSWNIDNVIFGEINLIHSETDTIRYIASFLQQKDYDRAIELINLAEDIYLFSADIKYNKGLYYSLIGDNEKALNSFLEATQLDVTFVEAYFNSAFICHSIAKLDEARNLYNKVITLQPNNVNAYNNLGTLFLYEKDYSSAKVCFKKCLEINPDFMFAIENLKKIEELNN